MKKRDNDINTLNNIKKDKSKLVIIIVLVLMLVIIIVGFGYSKYTETYKGEATAEVAKMICEMEVEPSEAKESIINPYCKVTIKDFNSNGVTETDVDYRIEVLPKDNIELPKYYWQDSSGTIICRNSELVGNFKSGVKEQKEYTIVFLNTGEKEILRIVEFNLVAVQGKE